MPSGILGIANSGLEVFQRALTTTSHNVTNAATEGYSRQRLDFSERNPFFTGAGFLGNGVETTIISRAYDGFLTSEVRTNTSSFTQLDTLRGLSAQIDSVVADPDVSLSPAVQKFFNAVHDVSTDPTSVAARQVMVSQGNALAERFKTLDAKFDEIRDQSNSTLSDSIEEINTLSNNIALLNQNISEALGRSAGRFEPNDLLDQRDLLIEKLAAKVDVRTIQQQDGAVNVFIGNGQSLVIGSAAAQLSVVPSKYDANRKDIVFNNGTGQDVRVTDNLSGGVIAGILQFQNEVLNPAQDALGRIAVGLAVDVNKQHQAGFDLYDQAGMAFFKPPVPVVLGASGSVTPADAVHVNYGDTSALQTGDYQLDFDGAQYTLTRLSDRTQFTSATGDFTEDGLVVSVDPPGLIAGDSFLIQPTRDAAGNLAMNLTDPRRIAAAASATAPGDNRNALAIADLQTAKRLDNSLSSYNDAYNAIVGQVGNQTQAAQSDSSAHQQLLNQARDSRDSVSRVNLDEEAANLVYFQQLYQASAQLVQVTNTMFNSLIGAVRG